MCSESGEEFALQVSLPRNSVSRSAAVLDMTLIVFDWALQLQLRIRIVYLLVTRQKDNHSPGPVPSSHQRTQ